MIAGFLAPRSAVEVRNRARNSSFFSASALAAASARPGTRTTTTRRRRRRLTPLPLKRAPTTMPCPMPGPPRFRRPHRRRQIRSHRSCRRPTAKTKTSRRRRPPPPSPRLWAPRLCLAVYAQGTCRRDAARDSAAAARFHLPRADGDRGAPLRAPRTMATQQPALRLRRRGQTPADSRGFGLGVGTLLFWYRMSTTAGEVGALIVGSSVGRCCALMPVYDRERAGSNRS